MFRQTEILVGSRVRICAKLLRRLRNDYGSGGSPATLRSSPCGVASTPLGDPATERPGEASSAKERELMTIDSQSSGKLVGASCRPMKPLAMSLSGSVQLSRPPLFTWILSRIRTNGGPPDAVSVDLGFTEIESRAVVGKPSVRGNPHLFVLGIPGQGKSWTVARILEEVSSQGLPSLVFDFHGQFGVGGDHRTSVPSSVVMDAARGLPFSPFEG